MKKVFFHYADRRLFFSDKKKLRNFIEEVFNKENKHLKSVDYIFCSDEYLLEINKTFLQHDYYTDIISFDLSIDTSITVGEIYISLDRVLDNSKQLEIAYKTEFLRVIIHGALHLCGYKDKSAKDSKLMRLMEDKYMYLYSQI